MKINPNKYFGVTTESLRTESFNISLTNHSVNSNIPLHSHDKPYLCYTCYTLVLDKIRLSKDFNLH